MFCIASVGAILIALLPTPAGLSIGGQYTLATTFFAGFLWVTGALPLAVTALTIPVLLTGTGIYSNMDNALSGFASHLIFLFMAGFMLANAIQKYDIDRRIALYTMAKMGSSPRRLIGAVMLSTAGLSMWISNTATTAMMTPIAIGVLSQVLTDDDIKQSGLGAHGGLAEGADEFTNIQIAMLLGTAYAASIGGVGTIIGTPPNAILVGDLNATLGYEIGFVNWLLIGLPIVVVTLPIAWFLLTYVLFPPEISNVEKAQETACEYLKAEDSLDSRGRRVAIIFAVTATLWVVGGLGRFLTPNLPDVWITTLFGGHGLTVFGLAGSQGILYYVMVGIMAIPALVLADTMEWDELADIDWGTLLLFGGGIVLAKALSDTGTTQWIVRAIFEGFIGMPVLVIITALIFCVTLLTEITSNTTTTTIIVPILIVLGGALASSLGVSKFAAEVFLAVTGAVAASFAFALPVATPPNAIVYGTGYVDHDDMLRTGLVHNIVMTVLLTGLVWLLFNFVWPMFI